MTDTNVTPTTPIVPLQTDDPSAQDAPAGDQKSPLDILEELLSDARQNKGASGGDDAFGLADSADGFGAAGGLGGDSGPSPEEEAQLAAQKQAEEAERQRMVEEQNVEDAAALKDQLHALEGLKQTPQYQARVQQDQEKVEQQQQQADQQDGFEIVQLGHKKI